MEEAIKYCIEHHILEEYLSRKGSEVMGFLCAEYDHEMALEVRGEEKYEDGFNDGIEQGEDRVYKLIEKLIKDNRNTEIEKITKDEEYRKKLYEEYEI